MSETPFGSARAEPICFILLYNRPLATTGLPDPDSITLTRAHGSVFGSNDPEAAGRAVAIAAGCGGYPDGFQRLLGAGWVPYRTPGHVSAISLAQVVQAHDPWVIVEYRTRERHFPNSQRTSKKIRTLAAAARVVLPPRVFYGGGLSKAYAEDYIEADRAIALSTVLFRQLLVTYNTL